MESSQILTGCPGSNRLPRNCGSVSEDVKSLSVFVFYIDKILNINLCRASLQGSADPLNSAFHLTYNMVLNLLRVEEINPEYMLEKSFYQFQHYRALPGVVESKLISICLYLYILLLFDLCSGSHLIELT